MVKSYRVQRPQRLQHPDFIRPEPPTIDETHAGEHVYVTGTCLPNYWIHLEVKEPNGSGINDLFQGKEDGTWKSLNYIPILLKDSIIKARQSKYEFDEIDKQSDEVQITVS